MQSKQITMPKFAGRINGCDYDYDRDEYTANKGVKEAFLQAALALAKAVGLTLIKAKGWASSECHINRGGVAVSGEVYAYYKHADGRGVHIEFGTSCMGPSKLPGGFWARSPDAFIIRAVTRHAGQSEGRNNYLDPDSGHLDIADAVERLAS